MTSNQPDLEIDLQALQISKGGKPVRLTQIEWTLLRVLIQHKDRPVPHKLLLKEVWGDAYDKETNYLHNCIARLRNKLGDSAEHPKYLLTLPKLGYQWVAPEALQEPAHFKSANKLLRHGVPPVPFNSFIGRERDLALLERNVRKKDVRLLTVTGPGGIGKTRLVFELAARLEGDNPFTDGAHFIDLSPIHNAEFVISAIAHEFGLREKAGEDPLSALKSYLREKNLLLILDNFEHVIAAAERIPEILTAARGAKILITSRERLNLYGEHRFEVPALSLSDRLQNGTGCVSEAVSLYMDRAQAINPRFEWTPENAPTLQQICERLDGVPLAIELAAIASARFTPSTLLASLQSQLQLLIDGPRNLSSRHQTLQAAIDWSYNLLDAGARRLFIWLSVFHGSFTKQAVEEICPMEDTSAASIGERLSSLYSKSLLNLQPDPYRDDTRYNMLGSFREYAACLLAECDAPELRRRHCEYYLHLLDELNREPSERAYKRLTLELGNLRAALTWAIAHSAGENALRLSVGMYDLWQRLGMLREGKQWLFDALDATENQPTSLRAHALYCAGALSDWLGDHQIAQTLYRESLRLYECLEDEPGIARALWILASALINQGDFIEGQSLSEQSLRMARQQNDPVSVGLALNNLGMISIYQGDTLNARSIYGEMISSSEARNDAQSKAWALTGLSWTSLLQGEYAAAQRFIDESMTLHQHFEDMLGTVLALTCDSWIALYRADFSEAIRKLQSCLTLCRELGLINLSLWPLVGLARINLHQGDHQQAQGLLEEAVHHSQQLNCPPITVWVYIALGISQRLESKYAAAFDDLDRALTLSQRREDKNAMVAALEQFAALAVAQRQPDLAAQLYGASAQMRETNALPLSTLDRIEYDLMTSQLQCNQRADWDIHWRTGRTLNWDGISQLIHRRQEGFE